eukprot:UN25215
MDANSAMGDSSLSQQSDTDEERRRARLNAFTVGQPQLVSQRSISTQGVAGGDDAEETTEHDLISSKLDAYQDIGVVSALLGCLTFECLSGVEAEELDAHHPIISYSFVLSCILSCCLNFFCVATATWVHYFGRLLLGYRPSSTSNKFLGMTDVVYYRHRSVLALMIAVPLFMFSLSFYCL